MKTITFQYTKDSGTVSDRTVCVTSEPNKFVRGHDVSELSPAQLEEFVREMSNAKAIYDEMVAQIVCEFDLVKNFRMFKPEGMSDVQTLSFKE